MYFFDLIPPNVRFRQRQLTLILSSIMVFSLCTCTNPSTKTDYIISERDLIPEGTAYDTRTGIVYVGSTFKRKIVQISPDGQVTDFTPPQMDGVWSIVGIEVDERNDKLWAATAHANAVMPLSNPHTSRDWMTNITVYDISSRSALKSYPLNVEQAFFNDLTVIDNGDVYITETVNNKIYRIPHDLDTLELFLAPEGFVFLNGITWSNNLKALYVSSVQGILNIDPAKGAYALLGTPDTIHAGRIDGLTFYRNSLIGHQSTKVSRFYLDDSGSSITHVDVLDSGDAFDSSTTGEIDGSGNYYFIVNSQISSAIDTQAHTIKPAHELNEVIIRKLKLKIFLSLLSNLS